MTTPDISMTSVPKFFQKYIARVSFADPSFPSYASWSGHGRIAWLLPRASPVAPTNAPSRARYAISCTPTPSWSSSKCRNAPSTNQLHVFSFQVGSSVLLNKDYCLNTSSSSKIFNQGGNAWNLFDFDNQSAAIICVDTIKYYSIPSVPSRFEGVEKTRPHSQACVGIPTAASSRNKNGKKRVSCRNA